MRYLRHKYPRRLRYRFSHAASIGGRKVYFWEGSRIPGDSRCEQIACDAEWFWSAPYKER